MKKRLLAFMLAFLLGITGSVVVCAEERANSVSAISGRVTINYPVSLEAGTPVLIVILPRILDGDVDVTEARVKTLSTKADLVTLDVKYAKTVKVNENGVVFHECKLSDSLTTGVYHTVVNYLGLEGGFQSIGIIDHVGKTDTDLLVYKFNNQSKENYPTIISEDMNGIDLNDDGDTDDADESAPKNILSKSYADVAYYEDLSDKAEFSRLLSVFKGETDFDIHTLVAAFNKAAVWIRLQAEADTFGVLQRYNGEGDGKHWNLDIGETSDYASLSDAEKNNILLEIKSGKYSDAATLSEAFTDMLVLSMFRSVTTREDVEALISTDSDYASYFAGVREIIEDADLENAYARSQMITNVLALAVNCESFEDIEKAFEKSVPEKKDGNEGTSLGGGSRGSSGGSNLGGVKVTTTEVLSGSSLPFKDVPASHWAYSYVERLYNEKVINGIAEDQFGLANKIQRQDFIKILIGALGVSVSNRGSAFSDVPDGAYYTPYVMAAYEIGLVAGTGDGRFNVGSNISREDVAVLVDRVITAYNIPVESNASKFNDNELVADYAKDAVARVAAAGIFTGDESGNFNPKEGLSRAETCAILSRLADRVEEVK